MVDGNNRFTEIIAKRTELVLQLTQYNSLYLKHQTAAMGLEVGFMKFEELEQDHNVSENAEAENNAELERREAATGEMQRLEEIIQDLERQVRDLDIELDELSKNQ